MLLVRALEAEPTCWGAKTGKPAARSPVFLSPPRGGSRSSVRLNGWQGPGGCVGPGCDAPSHQEAAFSGWTKTLNTARWGEMDGIYWGLIEAVSCRAEARSCDPFPVLDERDAMLRRRSRCSSMCWCSVLFGGLWGVLSVTKRFHSPSLNLHLDLSAVPTLPSLCLCSIYPDHRKQDHNIESFTIILFFFFLIASAQPFTTLSFMVSLGESQTSLKFSKLSVKKTPLWVEGKENPQCHPVVRLCCCRSQCYCNNLGHKVAVYLRCFLIVMPMNILNKFSVL